MTEVEIVRRLIPIEPVKNKPLGRHVEHDPRSRKHPIKVQVAPSLLKTVHHRRYSSIFDQLRLGSCTGNAAAGAINTKPFHKAGKRLLTEDDAVQLYSRATVLDGFVGSYPPSDTGSSGLAVAQAAQELGYITAYKHAFSVEEALSALQFNPGIIGIDWYEGFDNPDANGLVSISGQVRGGHEVEVLGFQIAKNLEEALVIAANSWGKPWGNKGRFCFTVATLRKLLGDQGDYTLFT